MKTLIIGIILTLSISAMAENHTTEEIYVNDFKIVIQNMLKVTRALDHCKSYADIMHQLNSESCKFAIKMFNKNYAVTSILLNRIKALPTDEGNRVRAAIGALDNGKGIQHYKKLVDTISLQIDYISDFD